MPTQPRCPECGAPLQPDVGDIGRHPLPDVLACLAHAMDVRDLQPRLYRLTASGRLAPVSLAASPTARERCNRKLGLEVSPHPPRGVLPGRCRW